MLTGAEAGAIADRLDDGDTLTAALQALPSARRGPVRHLVVTGGLAADLSGLAAVLRGVQGARSDATRITPLWTMPGQLAQYGALTSSLTKLVDDARESVTCATFNFQTTSGMWDALVRAAGRDEVAVTVYLDTLASQPAGGWVPPSAEAVAAHLKPARVFRTTSYEGRLVRTHAKFLAIDHRTLVVTSANFSWSAENGNVEFGVRIDDPGITEAVEKQLRDAEPVVYERVRVGPPFEMGEQR